MARILLTEPAAADIREILAYIRQQSPQAAKRVRAELRSNMQRLAEFPHIGHRREDLADETLRFWSVYFYLIAYRPETRPLEIIRVIHGARDVSAELRKE